MVHVSIRQPAVAGSWYPADPLVLTHELDRYLAAAPAPSGSGPRALIAPHAGLLYSGPIAAHAYRTLEGRIYDEIVLVGPSHYVGFEGVAIFERGAFATPLGPLPIAEAPADALMHASPLVKAYPAAHAREHSLEMQLPFLKRLLPETPIVPLVMGYQTRETILELARALVRALRGRQCLIVASSDLSHFFDAETAARLDDRVISCVERFDPDGLLAEIERYPEHERGRFVACGGGPMVAVMRAARELGARTARVLRHGDSSEVSGDKQSVVGYLAAAFSDAAATPVEAVAPGNP